MAEPIYISEVVELGPEVPEFLESGVLILFGDGAPAELAEVAVTHKVTAQRDEPPVPGDVVALGSERTTITAVGEKAWPNMLSLGHAVFKFDGAETAGLPGEISCEPLPADRVRDAITPGASIEIQAGDSS